jgi:hypothetical protein
VVSFTPLPLYPRRKSPRYPFDRRLGGPQSQSGWRGEEKILDPSGTRTPTPRPASRYTDWAIPGLPVTVTREIHTLIENRIQGTRVPIFRIGAILWRKLAQTIIFAPLQQFGTGNAENTGSLLFRRLLYWSVAYPWMSYCCARMLPPECASESLPSNGSIRHNTSQRSTNRQHFISFRYVMLVSLSTQTSVSSKLRIFFPQVP